MGLPWQAGVKITPLPEEGKPGYLQELIKVISRSFLVTDNI
jgi:hypothetical protein